MTQGPDELVPRSAAAPVAPADRMLAEAVSALERLDPAMTTDSAADEAGRAAGGDLENRIVARARALKVSTELADALRQATRAQTFMVILGAAAAAAAGIAAARAALASFRDEPVNFFWAIGAALGVQTLFLVIWVILIMATSASRSSRSALASVSIGAVVVRASQWVASRISRGTTHAAAFAAFARVNLGGRVGVWTISSISHGLWLVFGVACVGTLLVMLSARQYQFAWETTILSERQFVPMTESISIAPGFIGFPTPSRAQIESSQWPFVSQPSAEAMQAWSGLLIGAVVVYGITPRALLLLITLAARHRAWRRYRLEITRPDFARLGSVLMPPAQRIGVIDPDDSPSPADADHSRRASTEARPIGPPAILGYELPRRDAQASWPPAVHQVHWLDLGLVDTRDDQRAALRLLDQSPEQPQSVVMVCSLTASPDRGAAAFISELKGAVDRPFSVVLTGGHALRRRVDQHSVATRVNDWRDLAAQAGVDRGRIFEIDLDHLTQTTAATLATAAKANEEPGDAGAKRQIELAFSLIVEHVSTWARRPDAPSGAEEAELHRQIARLYQNESARWRDVIGAPALLGSSIAEQMKSGSERFLELLPARLKSSPRWIAAGAAAGALGCIAAATLVAPVAISALPMWTVVGGAVSGLLATLRSGFEIQSNETSSAESEGLADAVRSAALFAMLLELQGREEAAITRVLDHAVGDDAADPQEAIDSAETAREWLDRLRHQFDLAVAKEAAT